MSGASRFAERSARILVTGGGGFIGSHLCERLLEDGYRVWVLDSFESANGAPDRCENLSALRDDEHLHLVAGDIRDRVLLAGVLSDVPFDCVVHLAARSGEVESAADPWRCLDVNVNGTLCLLESMRRNQIANLILVSPRQIHGEAPGHANATDAGALQSPHAASKRAAELIGQVYASRYGLAVQCIRIGSVYGPRQPDNQRLSVLCRAILRDDQLLLSRDEGLALTYIDDVVEALSEAVSAVGVVGRKTGFEVHDLANAEPVLVPDLVRALARHLGVRTRVRLRPTGSSRSTAREAPVVSRPQTFVPRTDLETGLGRLSAWLREVEAAEPTPR